MPASVGIGARRRWVGFALAVLGVLLVTGLLLPWRSRISLETVFLAYLVAGVVTAIAGGLLPAIVSAVAGDLVGTYFFVRPYHSLRIASEHEVIEVLVFGLVTIVVSLLTEGSARSRGTAAAQAARAEELARIDATRTALLAAVSHDLRTPLAGIKASVATLRSDDLVLSDADRDELMGSIEDESDRLTGLVNNLLDLSRITTGALICRPQPVALDEVAAALRPVPSMRVQIPENLPLMQADPGLLERALDNVVQNSLQHGRGDVELTARCVGDIVEVKVIDHGDGVPPERYQEMFQPFQRLGDRRTAGTGLGLAIARGFIDAMGGAIEPSATPGGGLTVSIYLPVAS